MVFEAKQSMQLGTCRCPDRAWALWEVQPALSWFLSALMWGMEVLGAAGKAVQKCPQQCHKPHKALAGGPSNTTGRRGKRHCLALFFYAALFTRAGWCKALVLCNSEGLVWTSTGNGEHQLWGALMASWRWPSKAHVRQSEPPRQGSGVGTAYTSATGRVC